MHLRFARDDCFHDGWDKERHDFSRANGLLADNAITNGRAPGERINRVVTFTGQSLSGPPDTIPPTQSVPVIRQHPKEPRRDLSLLR